MISVKELAKVQQQLAAVSEELKGEKQRRAALFQELQGLKRAHTKAVTDVRRFQDVITRSKEAQQVQLLTEEIDLNRTQITELKTMLRELQSLPQPQPSQPGEAPGDGAPGDTAPAAAAGAGAASGGAQDPNAAALHARIAQLEAKLADQREAYARDFEGMFARLAAKEEELAALKASATRRAPEPAHSEAGSSGGGGGGAPVGTGGPVEGEDVGALKQQLASVQIELEDLTDEVALLRMTRDKFKQQADEAGARAVALEAELAGAQGRAMSDEKVRESGPYMAVSRQLEELQKDVEAARKEADKRHQDSIVEIASLRDKVKTLTQRGAETATELQAAQDSLAASQASLARARDSASRWRGEATAGVEALRATRAWAEALGMAAEEWRQRFVVVSARGVQLRLELDAQRARAEGAEAELGAAREASAQAEQRLAAAMAALDDQEVQAKIATRRSAQLARDLRQQLQRAREDATAAADRERERAAECEALAEEVERAKQQLAQQQQHQQASQLHFQQHQHPLRPYVPGQAPGMSPGPPSGGEQGQAAYSHAHHHDAAGGSAPLGSPGQPRHSPPQGLDRRRASFRGVGIGGVVGVGVGGAVGVGVGGPPRMRPARQSSSSALQGAEDGGGLGIAASAPPTPPGGAGMAGAVAGSAPLSQEERREKQLSLELAKRLQLLLAENETVRERVRHLEATVQLLQGEVEDKRRVLAQLAGGDMQNTDTGAGADHLALAALRESPDTARAIMRATIAENARLKGDMRLLGEEVLALKQMIRQQLAAEAPASQPRHQLRLAPEQAGTTQVSHGIMRAEEVTAVAAAGPDDVEDVEL